MANKTAKEILEDCIEEDENRDGDLEIVGFDYDKALHSLCDLIIERRPKDREIGEMRYGGCNPDDDRGFNSALASYDESVRKILEVK